MYNNFYAERTENQKPTTGKRRQTVRLAAFGLCCAVLGGAVGGLGAGAASKAAQTQAQAQVQVQQIQAQAQQTQAQAQQAQAENATTLYAGTRPTVVSMANIDGKKILSASEVYATNLGSVVGVNGNVTTNIWGQTVSNAVSGSGFVISSDGYILTNYHVVDGVSDITVFFADGTSYDAELVGGEEDNDIAVLKIDAAGLTPVVLGDSDSVTVGENVYAIGNPLGELTFTLTGGLVSAKDRSVTSSDGTIINMIQTDTAINSGNSGGPLFDQYGQAVGIVSAKMSGSNSSSSSVEGLGFAIPINDVRDMVTSIIQNGYVIGKPNLGILTGNANSFASMQTGKAAGCQVLAVLDGSCAAKGGLQAGDIITKVDDTEIASGSQLGNAILKKKAGETITLSATRNGETVTLQITLDEEDPKRQTEMTNLQNQYKASRQTDPFWGYGNNLSGKVN